MFQFLFKYFIFSSCKYYNSHMGLLGWLSGKESTYQCRRRKRCGFSLWVEKIPWGRSGNPLQYSCLENSMDRGAWQTTVHGVTKSRTQLSD